MTKTTKKTYFSSYFYYLQWEKCYHQELQDLFVLFKTRMGEYKIPFYFDTFCRFVFNHSTHNILRFEEDCKERQISV